MTKTKHHPSWDAEAVRKEIFQLMVDGLDNPDEALEDSARIASVLQEAGAASYRRYLADHLGLDVCSMDDVTHMDIVRHVGWLEGRAVATHEARKARHK
jgi:hypothetical protein